MHNRTKLAFAALFAATALTAQEPQQQKKPQVLFENHDAPVVTGDSPVLNPQPEQAPEPTGVSSSSHRPHQLHRRDEPKPEDVPGEPVPNATPAPADDDPTAPIVLTQADNTAATRITTAQRSAPRITATSLDLHLDAHTGETEARAQLTVRNTGAAPLAILPIRISAALHWESARITTANTTLPVEQHRLPDDLDHTGFSNELALKLPQPISPGASVKLDLYYSGTISGSAQRLLALGAPTGRAETTDWDTVSDTFTGLRGLGNVLWYPVTDAPASLRDGIAVPAAVETARTRDAAAPFDFRLTLQYAGSRPEAAFFCGERQSLKPLAADKSSQADNNGGVETAEWHRTALGPHTPSLFIASGAPQEAAGGLIHVDTDRADTTAALGEAAARVRPFLQDWLGNPPDDAGKPRSLNVIDLPIPGAAGFSDGTLLVAPLTTAPAAYLAPAFIQPLTLLWLPSDLQAPWLRDGIPAFLQSLWTERTEGRSAALRGLAAQSNTLKKQALPSPTASSSSASSSVSSSLDGDPSAGPSLATCADPVCARAKASYVFEMARNMVGDVALQQALSGWRIAVGKQPNHDAAFETSTFERLLQQTAGKKDLSWFFQSWIDADHGLPELSIVTVAPRRMERDAPTAYLPQKQAYGGPIGAEPVPKPGDPDSVAPRASSQKDGVAPTPGSWLVAVEVQNAGDADAEVPVTVRNGGLTNTLPLHIPAHGRATVRVPFEAAPQEVLVNDGSVPERTPLQHRRTITGLQP